MIPSHPFVQIPQNPITKLGLSLPDEKKLTWFYVVVGYHGKKRTGLPCRSDQLDLLHGKLESLGE